MNDRDIADSSARPRIVDKTNFSYRDSSDKNRTRDKQAAGKKEEDSTQQQSPSEGEGSAGSEEGEPSFIQYRNAAKTSPFPPEGADIPPSAAAGKDSQVFLPWDSDARSLAITPQESETITAAFDRLSGIHGTAIIPRPKNLFLHWFKEIAIVIVISLLLSFVVKTFFFRAFYIPSGSMENTLQVDDRIFVSLLTPRYFDLKRGDVVVFEDTFNWLPQSISSKNSGNWLQQGLIFLGLMPDDSQQHLIKRLIGMPGDRITCCSVDGKLAVNGVPIAEPYLYPGSEKMTFEFDVTVPEGHIWVMGDHRNASADSRFHLNDPDGAFIPLKSVTGKANAVAWPLNRWGIINSHPEAFKEVPDAAAP